jgi:hypothetical protein
MLRLGMLGCSKSLNFCQKFCCCRIGPFFVHRRDQKLSDVETGEGGAVLHRPDRIDLVPAMR